MRLPLVYHDLFVTCTLGCYNRITFWAVCVRIIRTLGTSEEQGAYTVTGFWVRD